MGKHTQGEWIARPDPHGSTSDWCIGLNDDVSPVDYVAVCRYNDARLIAAAPDLLEAALEAVAEMRDSLACPSDDWDCFDKLLAAIAKATT